MKIRYLFVHIQGPQGRVDIFGPDDELHYSWPLHGGYLQVFTEYFLRRVLDANSLQYLFKHHIMNAVLDPKVFRFPAPTLYNRIRPSLWARVKSFLNNLRK